MVNPGTELSSIDFGGLIGGPLCAVIEASTKASRATADFIKTVGFDENNKPIYVDFTYPKEVQPYQPGKIWFKVDSISIEAQGAGYTAAPAITFSPPDAGETSAVATAVLTQDKVTSITFSNHGKYLKAPTVIIGVAPETGTTAKILAVSIIDHTEPGAAAVYQNMKISVPILTILPIPFIRIETVTIDFNAKINAMETSSESTDTAISGNLQVQQRWPGGRAKLSVSASYQKKTASGSTVEHTYSMQIHVQASQDEMPAGMEKMLTLLEGAMLSVPVG